MFSIFASPTFSHMQLTTEKCVSIAKDIASGLQYMHSRSPKVIHRDIKPLNVMVSNKM